MSQENIKTYKQNNSSESTLTGESIFIFQKLVSQKYLFSIDINQENNEIMLIILLKVI
ncbi:MAG: hypothetical protein CM15mP13_2360 [Pseudomonadota bacterium]|nr:MAG: hypothetical protein CM15mP13_2360 [Pseudomonadota bacterium]